MYRAGRQSTERFLAALEIWSGAVRASGVRAVLDGHLISRLRAPAYCAPNQPVRLFRCSAWLILQKQSTGLFLPKRSCFRASPLHKRTVLPLRESPVFRSAYFPKTVHRTVFSKTLDLQGFAPPGKPSRGSRGCSGVRLCAGDTSSVACGRQLPLKGKPKEVLG